MNRRRFLLGAGALLVAPSIVRASSLMPCSAVPGDVYGRSPLLMAFDPRAYVRVDFAPGVVTYIANSEAIAARYWPVAARAWSRPQQPRLALPAPLD